MPKVEVYECEIREWVKDTVTNKIIKDPVTDGAAHIACSRPGRDCRGAREDVRESLTWRVRTQ